MIAAQAKLELHRLNLINSSPPGQMATILADNIFKCIFLNEIDRILIWISLKFVPRRLVDSKPT